MNLRRVVPLVVATALVIAGCGGSDSPESGGAGAESPAASTGLPSVELTEVASGDKVSLDSLVPSQTPVLAWFWAPH